MIVVFAPELRRRVSDIFCAVGASRTVSARVADSLVESNLVGHDSHGVIRVPTYVRAIQEGRLNPNGEIQIARESASTTVLDCDRAFGQVAAKQGIELAVTKARQHDIAMVTLYRCQHIGRLGEYVVMAAEQGFVGLVLCNGSGPGGTVAPFGGIGRAIGTDPIAWGIPSTGRPVFSDFATSAVAHGKVQVAMDEGHDIPLGWILDKEGRATQNPKDLFDGGMMLPFGGHKGYALGVIVELLGGGLSGAGVSLQPGYQPSQGTVMVAINVEAFQPLDAFRRMVADFAERIKLTPRADGCQEILMPGEPEWQCKEKRERQGIEVPDKTWTRLAETAESLGVQWD
jgi:uncharacterized oxidoreductase